MHGRGLAGAAQAKGPRPAHETKHLASLSYPFRPSDRSFQLSQVSDGHSNGTALWLGAQCLSLYLVDIARRLKTAKGSQSSGGDSVRPRAIELGSGTGLTALALSSMGWDVLATDMAHVVSSVLRSNIERNVSIGHESACCGKLQVRELDWTVSPCSWSWSDPDIVASHGQSLPRKRPELVEDTEDLLEPPFDLIITADTVYSPSLIGPLLRTLHNLCSLSIIAAESSNSFTGIIRGPIIYLALENRDPGLVDSFITQGREEWHFHFEKIPSKKVYKAMEKGGVSWDRREWEGVDLWKMTFSQLKQDIEN